VRPFIEALSALSLGKEEEEKRMRKLKVSKIWISALLAFMLAVLLAGCGDPDGGPGNPGDPLTPPTVTSVTPPDGSALVCPNTAVISATFSKAMNPATINTSTFTLTSSGGSVAGQVSYNASSSVATFTPTASLAVSTTFTATITTGAADTFGNTLAANFVWTFTTSAACAAPPPPPVLGTACSFGILGGSTVTNVVGTATTINGDVGVWPGSAVTGFGPPASITGTIHAGDATAQTAQGDLTTAYNNAAGAAGGAVLPPDIGGSTLFPGVYKTTSAQPSLGITGNLTLDGQGDPNATWIFQVVSTLDTAAGNSQVLLIGSAQSHNVVWQVGSSATLGTNTIFEGTIMAQASVTLTTGATLNGRALARTGAVTLDTNTVVVPPCP
jgi:Ice-binding-like/Bacterial Ig-like domain